MKILVLVTPAAGHYLPMAALTEELALRGNEIIYYVPEEFTGKFSSLGVPVKALTPGPGPRFSLRAHKERFTSRNPLKYYLHARRFVAEWIDRHLNEATAERLSREAFDLVLADDALICAKTVAERLRVPLINVNGPPLLEPDRTGQGYPLLYPGLSAKGPWRVVRKPLNSTLARFFDFAVKPWLAMVNERRKRLGFKPHRSIEDSFSDLLLLYTYPPELAGRSDSRLSGRQRIVGPLFSQGRSREEIPEAILSRFSGRPVVYVCFGTISDQRLIEPVLSAIRGPSVLAEYFFVFSHGLSQGEPYQILETGPHFLVFNRVNQIAMLKHAGMMVGHGGLNGVLEALYMGCGLLCVAQKFDQKGIALAISDLGLGMRYASVQDLCVRLPRDLPRLWNDPIYRARIEAYSRKLREMGGARAAAEAVDAAFAARRSGRA